MRNCHWIHSTTRNPLRSFISFYFVLIFVFSFWFCVSLHVFIVAEWRPCHSVEWEILDLRRKKMHAILNIFLMSKKSVDSFDMCFSVCVWVCVCVEPMNVLTEKHINRGRNLISTHLVIDFCGKPLSSERNGLIYKANDFQSKKSSHHIYANSRKNDRKWKSNLNNSIFLLMLL